MTNACMVPCLVILRTIRIASFALLANSVTAEMVSTQPTSTPVQAGRVRARELGITPGIFHTGKWDAITDVAGVRVGHATVSVGDSIRTGVTAIIPHSGDLYRDRVPAALHVGNGFGKLLGSTQLAELGELETPILLTCTLCIWQAGDALVQHMLALPGNAEVRSINPVVGETNDGTLNETRARPGIAEAVRQALNAADTGAVAEGSVGAGHGTVMFGWKGGIGTSSRVLPSTLGGYTVGVIVQGNYGGVLQIAGVPIGQLLGQYSFSRDVATDSAKRNSAGGSPNQEHGDGSCMIVIATDAPMLDRNLKRLAARAVLALGRTGSSASNGSGDYVIAFSTAKSARRSSTLRTLMLEDVGNETTSALFQAASEATEEALYNALFMATPVSTRRTTVGALPLDTVRALLRARGITKSAAGATKK